ncbi:hypothetical protein CC86DRAFT_407458 [Ophiobolus disseminans]|uniref:Uncharacterized protein n=1 Tax=Ophiobolus disseminans TaxID=1469910 RepID=A0A6A6ZY34_9PLEO|nr:hypothetical protein CC86DRAFT_407458 [Ophiobolus disseminans]
MLDLDRLYQLAREAGAHEKDFSPPVEPPGRDSIALSLEDKNAVKEKLVLQRRGSAYYKDPTKQARNLFRTKTKKAALNDFSDWTFNKAERFMQLNHEIRNKGHIGLAQAILLDNPEDPLDVDQVYKTDDQGNAFATGKPNGWLELVTERNDVPYIRLLCASGASQQSKNQAFGVALKHGAMGAVQELLRNHADPNFAGIDYFLHAVATDDKRLVRLFLTAIIPVLTEHLSHALILAVDRTDPDTVASLLAHGAEVDYRNGEALCTSIVREQFEEVATILLYSCGTISQLTLQCAIKAVCGITKTIAKHRFFELLFYAGAETDTLELEAQLLQAVECHDRPIVKLLIDHGTSPESNDAESLGVAIAAGKIDLVPMLLQGHISEKSISKALGEAAGLEDDEQYEIVMLALLEKGVHKDSLHKCLSEVVRRRLSPTLAAKLIGHGANSNYGEALCIRLALQQNDWNLLNTLLEASCEPTILVKVLPIAMAIQPRSECLHVVRSLLQKGISGKELHVALQTLARQASAVSDYQLMDLLIKRHASIDFRDSNGNCLCIAAANRDERALDLLVEGDPSPDTVSEALRNLPVSLAEPDAAEYEKSVRIIRAFLEKKARGEPVAQKLVVAVRDDHRSKILDLLLHYGADANYSKGSAVAEALRLPEAATLGKLCDRPGLSRETLTIQLPNALNPNGYDFRKASIIITTAASHGHKSVLDLPLLQEIKINGSRPEILDLLVNSGADPNYQHGEALRQAVAHADIRTTRLLLTAEPRKSTVAKAIPTAMQIKDVNIRYTLMQDLMAKGDADMYHDALVQTAREAEPDNLNHVQLLLQYGASPNFDNGAAVTEAIKARNIPLLNLFLANKLNAETLTNAFRLTVRQQCSQEERRELYKSLFTSKFTKFETSEALVETVRVSPFDIETATLLLSHGASVDLHSGVSLQTVAIAGSVDLLQIFLGTGPIQKSRDEAFVAAVRAGLHSDVRQAVYVPLLQAGVSVQFISWALLTATRNQVIDKSLLTLLVKFSASLDYEDGSALHDIVKTGDVEAVRIILEGSVSNKKTLNKAFEAAMDHESATRLAIAKQILEKQPGVFVEVLSRRLAWVVREKDSELLKLLMSYKPDVTHNHGESLVAAAQAGNAELTAILSTNKVPSATLNSSFEAMLQHRTIQKAPDGLKTASILLPLGIDQHLLDQALLDAFDDPINKVTRGVVELLSKYKPDFNGDDGKVFVLAACSDETDLFEKMASQLPSLDVIIPSLIQCFEGMQDDCETSSEGAVSEKDNVPEMVEFSENDEQTVEEQSTRPLQPTVEDVVDEAIEKDFEDHVEPAEAEGMNHKTYDPREVIGPDEEVLVVDDAENTTENESTPRSSMKRMPTEKRLIHYLQILEDHAGRGDRQLDDFIIFKALACFPNGHQLVQYLLDHGCSSNSKIQEVFDASHKLLKYELTTEPEQMNAVTWALSRTDPEISEEVILEILEGHRKADISFRTSITGATAAAIASAGGRDIVLQRLIELGADVSYPDRFEQSPSFYASRNGHLEIVRILHDAGAKRDEGSLQEAAREAYPDIVALLLASDHRADFPSGIHADARAGRTALEELCLYAAPGDDMDDWNDRIAQCIKQLLPGKIENGQNDKTMLHLALLNNRPVPVTRALLEFPMVWENINDATYLFRDEEGYFYSPTKYVETFCENASTATTEELLILLKAKKCIDRFYAHTVDQPTGAIGLPPHIAAAVEKEMRARHEHQEALQRQTDLAARQRAIEAEDYRRKAAEDKERHDILRRQQREREESDAQAFARKQEREKKHTQDIQRARQSAIVEENRLKQQGLASEASSRDAMRRSEQAAELSHKQHLASQEYSALQQKLSTEQSLISAREQAGKAEASRLQTMLNARKEAARYEADQRIRAAQSANGY